MAKDTAPNPGEVDWGALQELRAAGLTNEQIGELSAQRDPGRRTGGKEGFYYDLEGNLVQGVLPEYGAYDPEYGAFRESSTSPIPDRYYTDNMWGLGSPTSENSTPGFVWNGPGPAPTGGQGISDLFGGLDGGSSLVSRPDGSYGVDLSDEALGNWGQPAQGGGELTLGGNNPAPLPEDAFPYLPYTGSEGVTFGAPPKDREFGKYLGTTNENLGTGPKGVQGIDPGSTPSLEGLLPDLQGYESSSNKDFYQRQFQEMMGQQTGTKLNDLATAIRRQEAPAIREAEGWAALKEMTEAGMSPQDIRDQANWGWANLPDVQMGTGNTGGYNSIVQNPRFDWGQGTDNAQILNDLRPILGTNLGQFVDKNPIDDAPSLLDRNAFNEYLTTKNPNDKGFQAAWDKVLSNVHIPDPTTRGPSAPVGYASPLNTYGE